jgi:hypothetical protein
MGLIAGNLLPLLTATLGGRDQRGDEQPFVVGQITRIAQFAAIVAGAGLGRPNGGTHWQCSPVSHTSAKPGKTVRGRDHRRFK